MTLLYAFPSSIYDEPPSDCDLDEVNVLAPLPGTTLTINTATTAKFRLKVNSESLTCVTVRLTMTRYQVLSGTNPVAPTGSAWGYVGLLGEASWTTLSLAHGTVTEFEVAYTPTLAGDFTYSFSVEAEELRVPACTQVDVVVA
jgi:hypothetical protein